jgi:hypothetical protein
LEAVLAVACFTGVLIDFAALDLVAASVFAAIKQVSSKLFTSAL